jgi:hypothetical protein
MMIRGSAVGIESGYQLNDRWSGIRILLGLRMFTASCQMDTESSFPYIKADGAWNSPLRKQ